MSGKHHDDHDHDHNAPESGPALRVKAIETLLVEKGLVDPKALDALVDTYENKVGPRNGARVVARAWVDPVFKARLLEDAAVAMTLAEMRAAHDGAYAVAGKRRYPSGRSVCDLATGELPDWAIEVKLARLGRLITSGWALRKALQPGSRRTARRRLPSRSAWPAHYPSQILPDRLMHVREQVSGLCKVHPPHCS